MHFLVATYVQVGGTYPFLRRHEISKVPKQNPLSRLLGSRGVPPPADPFLGPDHFTLNEHNFAVLFRSKIRFLFVLLKIFTVSPTADDFCVCDDFFWCLS